MPQAFSHLGDISIAEFLRDYWQQQPLLIPQAIPGFSSALSADELAGLALEDFVESRIVTSDGWRLEYGPFTERQFANLPKNNWTLLVQGVDQLVPDVASLLDYFRFLPSWRLDDIMVSYATDGGSVGPHFDHYDVFLLQAEGRRRWRLGGQCAEDAALVENTELAILAEFNNEREWLLEPGDMLYIPPKVSHWGIAEGDCMTYSIGFRAPDSREILSHFCDDRLDREFEGERYRDGSMSCDSYQINDEAVAEVRRLLLKAVDDPVSIASWFGRFMTTPRYDELSAFDTMELEAASNLDNDNSPLCHAKGVRFAYFRREKNAWLFANGQHWLTTEEFARTICNGTIIYPDDSPLLAHSENNKVALADLLRQGFLIKKSTKKSTRKSLNKN